MKILYSAFIISGLPVAIAALFSPLARAATQAPVEKLVVYCEIVEQGAELSTEKKLSLRSRQVTEAFRTGGYGYYVGYFPKSRKGYDLIEITIREEATGKNTRATAQWLSKDPSRALGELSMVRIDNETGDGTWAPTLACKAQQ